MNTNYIIRLIFFIFFFLYYSFVFSQDASPNKLDEKYTPGKNSIFNSASSKVSGRSDEYSEIKNSIKINPFLFTRNIFAIFWERFITDGLTLQPGIGISFNKDPIQNLFIIDLEITDISSSLTMSQIMKNGVFFDPSVFLAFSSRFYYDSYDTYNSGYMEIGTRYYVNNLTISSGDDIQIVGKPQVSLRNWVFDLTYGVQFMTSGKIKTTHEFLVGVGIKATSYDVFEEKQTTIINQGYPETITSHVKTSARENITYPTFLFSYVFGIGF